MPNPLVSKLAAKTGKSVATVEKYWNKAKEITKRKFKVSDPRFYPYLVGILKRMVDLVEEKSELESRVDLLLEGTSQSDFKFKLFETSELFLDYAPARKMTVLFKLLDWNRRLDLEMYLKGQGLNFKDLKNSVGVFAIDFDSVEQIGKMVQWLHANSVDFEPVGIVLL